MRRWCPWSLVTLLTLVGCAELQPTLRWLEPQPNSVVVGPVELVVEALGPSPDNVVFYLDDRAIAKAYLEEEHFRATWDSSATPPGEYVLSAKPYGETEITTRVVIATRRAKGE